MPIKGVSEINLLGRGPIHTDLRVPVDDLTVIGMPAPEFCIRKINDHAVHTAG